MYENPLLFYIHERQNMAKKGAPVINFDLIDDRIPDVSYSDDKTHVLVFFQVGTLSNT